MKPLISEKEAAAYLGMSRIWLAKGRAERNPDSPPYIKLGRAVRYNLQTLDSYLADRTHGGNTVESN